MYGEDALVRQDRARAKREESRKERRDTRSGAAHGNLDADTTFLCASCGETFADADRVPGTATCFGCDLTSSADAALSDVGPGNLRTTWGLVGLQLALALAVVGLYAMLLHSRPDQAFAVHSFAVMPGSFASLLGVAHAVRSPARAPGHAGFHAVAGVAWVVSWVAMVFAGH
ncbi:MAG: hypothetical protein R3F61_05160 [Myxococcota bacterium]